jgi:hypothetical protein
MQHIVRHTAVFGFALGVLASPLSAQSRQGRVVHKPTFDWRLTQSHDTVVYVRASSIAGTDALQRADTSVYVFVGDSAVRLRPAGPRSISAVETKHLRTLVKLSARHEELERQLARPLR